MPCTPDGQSAPVPVPHCHTQTATSVPQMDILDLVTLSVAIPLGYGVGTRAVPKDDGIASSRQAKALLTRELRSIFSFSY